ncbi:MAG: hypothetical protein AUJ96_30320 [Armatimonadetes bacterium CG2_30_66_41]|nr:hypothetical protein [Armatimonadota bacterium]OIO93435.1 MAG: hypothetical protein AUJ96_30320 [Armatimonadetes bacterium CG2_30_66_41]PIU92267.1 MAG: hypothetical protein COS65_18780 [Armatimonadetes bacterium CG06_land_8_20_14_3_00_66_21]
MIRRELQVEERNRLTQELLRLSPAKELVDDGAEVALAAGGVWRLRHRLHTGLGQHRGQCRAPVVAAPKGGPLLPCRLEVWFELKLHRSLHLTPDTTNRR